MTFRSMTPARLAAVLAAGLVLVLTAPAAAAALPITFDGLAAGTKVTDQFAEATFHDPNGSAGLQSEVPVVADVGASRAHSGTKVALSDCFACEFEHHVVLAQLSRRAESVSVRVGFLAGSRTTARRIRVEALGSSRQLLGSTAVGATAANFRTLATVDPPGTAGTIAFVRLTTVDAAAEGERFGIDDLAYTSSGAAAPDIAVAARTAGVTIRPGGSTTVPVDVLRFNGSSGAVTLSASELPAGVTTRTIAPNPVSGSTNASATLTLDAATSASPGSSAPRITAVPAGPAVGPATRTARFPLTVEKAFDVLAPANAGVPPCGSATVHAVVSRARSGFTAPVRLAVSGLPAGYEVTPDTTTVDNPVEGFDSSVPLTIRATRPGLPVDRTFTITATSAGLPAQRATVMLRRGSGTITSIAPTTGSVPQVLREGTLVELRGTGFCPGAAVQFGNQLATATPVELDPAAGRIRARVPRLATTGRVSVVSRDGTITSPGAFTVLSPRNTEGFRFDNPDHPGVNLGVVQELYGKRQTNISVNPCWPFDCTIVTPVPSPLTGLYIGISNAVLEDDGSCFGVALTSQHIATGVSPIAGYAPAGATSAWGLEGDSGPGPALSRRIRMWHNAQLSANFLSHWLRSAALNLADHGRGSLMTLRNELRAGRNPMVALRDGLGGGHVVVAHDLSERPDGGYQIHVYDPNLWFDADAELAPDGVKHADRESRSIVTVEPSGRWKHVGDYGSGEWSGGADAMVVAPLSVMSGRLRMPTDLRGLATVITPFGDGGAEVAQVSDGRGRRLLGEDGGVNADPGTRIPGATVLTGLSGDDTSPMYVLDRRGTYAQSLKGTRDGTTGTAIVGPGFAARLSGLRTRKGALETVRVTSSAGAIAVEASSRGALRLRLGRGLEDGTEATADVRVSGGRGGHDFRLDPQRRGGFRYDNDTRRRATVRATLNGAGREGVPGSRTVPAIRVPAGGRVEAQPSSWSRLGESRLRVRVRDARGRVVAQRDLAPQAPRWVSRVRLSAHTRRGDQRVARVRVRLRGAPRGARMVVAVHARRGRRLAAGESLTVPARAATRTRTYRIPLTLPPGRYTLHASAGVVTQTAKEVRTARVSARHAFRAR